MEIVKLIESDVCSSSNDWKQPSRGVNIHQIYRRTPEWLLLNNCFLGFCQQHLFFIEKFDLKLLTFLKELYFHCLFPISSVALHNYSNNSEAANGGVL